MKAAHLLPWLDPRLRRPVAAGRWVVVDVETAGLDPGRDALIAIGALAVVDGVIDLGDAFEVVLRQECASSPANIEVHGIGGTEQMAGMPMAQALEAFLRFVGEDEPLVAFHAPFDAAVLGRAMRAGLGRAFQPRWLDLADVAPLAWPGRAGAGLDSWLQALDIPMAHRHRAIVDCLATAQLFQALLHEAPRLGAHSAGGLLRLARSGRWLA